MLRKIPLTKPYWGSLEQKTVLSALKNSTGVGDGPWSKKLVSLLKEITGAKYIFPVTSCTAGLELAMAALGVGPGEEVILPSFTMTSTANCILNCGATPVFADIDKRTYNIDSKQIEPLINKRTRGIMVVHYGGMPVELENIKKIAEKYRLFLVEDAAHAIGAKYKDKMLGTFGDVGVYSFHGTKNISCGEGGAIVTNDEGLAKKMEIYRMHGTNRSEFLRGMVNKYTWVGKGSSYALSDLLAALVYAQLKKMETVIYKRRKIASYYQEYFTKFKRLVQLPIVPSYTFPNWHIYALSFFIPSHRDVFIVKMREKGIEVSSHYEPLHTSSMGRKLAGNKRNLPVTGKISRTLVRLPIYPGLTERELSFITQEAGRILEKFSRRSDSQLRI